MSTSAQLLGAAERLVAEQGHRDLSMRRLAGAVGLSPMAAYRHFAGRDELLDAVAEAGFHRLEAALATGARSSDPRERIVELLVALADFALAERNLFELLFLTVRAGIRRYPEDFERQRSRSFRKLQEDVESCMAGGSMLVGDSLEVSLALWAQAHGLLALQHVGRFGPDHATFRSLFRRCVERHVEGICT